MTVRSILKGAHFQILSEESPLGFLDQWEGGNAPEFELFESSDPKGHYPTSTFFKVRAILIPTLATTLLLTFSPCTG